MVVEESRISSHKDVSESPSGWNCERAVENQHLILESKSKYIDCVIGSNHQIGIRMRICREILQCVHSGRLRASVSRRIFERAMANQLLSPEWKMKCLDSCSFGESLMGIRMSGCRGITDLVPKDVSENHSGWNSERAVGNQHLTLEWKIMYLDSSMFCANQIGIRMNWFREIMNGVNSGRIRESVSKRIVTVLVRISC